MMKIQKKLFIGIPLNFTFCHIPESTRSLKVDKIPDLQLSPGDENVISIRAFQIELLVFYDNGQWERMFGKNGNAY